MAAPDGGDPKGFQRRRTSTEGESELAAAFFKQARGDGLRRLDPPDPSPAEVPPATQTAAEPVEPEAASVPASEASPPAPPTAPDPDTDLEAEAPSPPPAPEEVEASPEAEPEAPLEASAGIELSDGTQLTPAEVEAGYLRQGDYTRKTQELATQRREVEEARAGVDAQMTERMGQLEQLAGTLEHEIARYRPSAAQMQQLRQQNPGEWSARMAELQNQDHMVRAARVEQARLREEQRQASLPAEKAALATADPKAFGLENFEATYQNLGRWITSPEGGGLPPEVWDRTTDHRMILLAHKAMKYDQATGPKARAPKNLGKIPKVIRPGAVQRAEAGETEEAGYRAAVNRVGEQSSLENLAAGFLALDKRNKARGRGRGGMA